MDNNQFQVLIEQLRDIKFALQGIDISLKDFYLNTDEVCKTLNDVGTSLPNPYTVNDVLEKVNKFLDK